MHDLDRTQFESDREAYELHEQEGEEFLGGLLGAITGGELETPLNETLELELASELLEVQSEEELDRFLGNVFRTVGQAVGSFARSDAGRALGGILKDAAGKALPVIGGAIGGAIAPGRGATVGQRLGAAAGSLLGLELEGMSAEDREFEAARQFVRFTSTAYRDAATAPPGVPGPVVARQAAVAAARRFAPGLVVSLVAAGEPSASPQRGSQPQGNRRPSGRWRRRNRTIVIYGA